MKKTVLYLSLAGIILLPGCASQKQLSTKADSYKSMYEEKPVTVLIMPPVNRTENVAAKDIFHSSLCMPICNAGYYVIPPFLSMEILKQESAYDSELFFDAPLAKFGEVFGADLALFTIIHTWNKKAARINVEIEYIFKSVKTNEIVYQRKGIISLSPQVVSPTLFSPVGLITAAVGTMVNIIDNATTDNAFVGMICNNMILSDLPAGPYSPLNGNDGNLFAGKKDFKNSLSGKAKIMISTTNQYYSKYTGVK